MKFEILTGEDAEKAMKAGEELQRLGDSGGWIDVKLMEAAGCSLYRIKPQPKAIRKPLADLRVLAGSMLVNPEGGGYDAIKEIDKSGGWLKSQSNVLYYADFLAFYGFHYAIGGTVKPCWTEEEVEG